MKSIRQPTLVYHTKIEQTFEFTSLETRQTTSSSFFT